MVKSCYCRLRVVSSIKYKNSSGDEIANMNFFYDDIAHVLQNTKKREHTSFNKLDSSYRQVLSIKS